jgi:ABC-type glutathione transport system ATPase component
MRKHFGPVAAVDGVDLDVSAGEIFGLLGTNGAGKTTATRVLTTLLPPDGGEVTVFGRDVTTEPFAVRRLIGYGPQQLSADRSLTGRENVGLFARLFDVPRRQRAARTDEVLAVVELQKIRHVQRALSDKRDARMDPLVQLYKPAELRGGRASGPAHRHARAPVAGRSRVGGRAHNRSGRGGCGPPPPRPLISAGDRPSSAAPLLLHCS